MIKEEEINGMYFVEQTTFYIYKNKEDRDKDKPVVITSCKKAYKNYKKNEKAHTVELILGKNKSKQ